MRRLATRAGRRAALLAWLFVNVACGSSDAATKPPATQARVEVVLTIDGMACEACASRIEAELRGIEGVHEASVEFAKTQARVIYDPASVSEKALSEAVAALGFENRIASR